MGDNRGNKCKHLYLRDGRDDACTSRCPDVGSHDAIFVHHYNGTHGRHGPLARNDVVLRRAGHTKGVHGAWGGEVVHLVVKDDASATPAYFGAEARNANVIKCLLYSLEL